MTPDDGHVQPFIHDGRIRSLEHPEYADDAAARVMGTATRVLGTCPSSKVHMSFWAVHDCCRHVRTAGVREFITLLYRLNL